MKLHIVARQMDDSGSWVASIGERDLSDESLDSLVRRCRAFLLEGHPEFAEGVDYEIAVAVDVGDGHTAIMPASTHSIGKVHDQ